MLGCGLSLKIHSMGEWFSGKKKKKRGEGGTFRYPRERSLGHQRVLFVEISVFSLTPELVLTRDLSEQCSDCLAPCIDV